MAPFPKTLKKPARGSIGFARCWSICATQFNKKSTAERPKIKPSPQSNFLNTSRCRDINPKEKSPCGAPTGKSWARSSEKTRLPHENVKNKDATFMPTCLSLKPLHAVLAVLDVMHSSQGSADSPVPCTRQTRFRRKSLILFSPSA